MPLEPVVAMPGLPDRRRNLISDSLENKVDRLNRDFNSDS